MKFYFGNDSNYLNVTQKVIDNCKINNDFFIPKYKTYLFGDPVPFVVKKFKILYNDIVYILEEYDIIYIKNTEIFKVINNNFLLLKNISFPIKDDIIIKTKNIHPISFSIPSEKIITQICPKEKLMAYIIPGNQKTYIYKKEEDYYKDYQISFFGTTMLKAGYDCLRHYEILANGCIPYFIDIQNIPKKTMHNFPKNIISESNNLYEKIIKNGITNDDKNNLLEISKILLDYTKNNLTTEHCANYILEKTKNKNVSKILFLSGDVSIDYLRCMTLHGFKKIFGVNCHDYPLVPHLYHNITNTNRCASLMTCSKLLDIKMHDFNLDYDIENNIKNKYFDIVIYGSYHRGLPFFELVEKIYEPPKIIMLCGEDLHYCDKKKYFNIKGFHTFVREL